MQRNYTIMLMKDEIGYISSTESFGTVDGPGIRYVVFLQGCPLRCLYCHNADFMDLKGGVVWTAGNLTDEILRYSKFIKNGGVTFSGGEPLHQAKFVEACIMILKEYNIHTAIDTSGCENIDKKHVKLAVGAADLILLDIKSADTAMARELTGIGNENSIATLDYCEQNNKNVWIRQVLLEGYTLDKTQLLTLADLLDNYNCVKCLELIPFHKMGEYKWENAGITYTLRDTPAVTNAQIKWAAEFFNNKKYEIVYTK